MAMYEEFAPQPNRLIHAESAYLRSAAYQPVGWYEYGDDAFAEARRQNKPILLDIGAIWCHWCHVIDRESYDNPEIATYINELFIPIKVDRDAQPDIDARYQTATHLLIGQGGWPLTVFLTPDGEPFYAGTYFPPDDQGARVGMKTLLPKLADAYHHRRHELDAVAHTLTERTRESGSSLVEPHPISDEILQQINRAIRTRFNAEHGGFERTGPKFPQAGAIGCALRQWYETGDEMWRTIVETTLQAMGRGGIYDQLGGGFHRYATDAAWIIPHFEKMAADNAILLSLYAQAYRATGNESFREIAEGTLSFIMRTFADQQRGGFFSTQDADSSLNDDGAYWTWTFAEFTEALLPDEVSVLARHYGITRRGNLPGTDRNVLHIAESPVDIAHTLELPIDEVHARIARGKAKLYAVRQHRKIPYVDTNKYANWNALLISACLECGILLQQEKAVDFAVRSAEVLLRDAYESDHGIYHHFHGEHGASLPGLFEDQVYSIIAFLDVFGASAKPEFLETARQLMDLCLREYWDEAHGGFLDMAREREETAVTPFLRHSRKPIDDMPTPAPNAVAALALDRLWLLTHDARYHDAARQTLETFAKHAPDYGPFAGTYGLALSYHLQPPVLITILGDLAGEDTRALQQTALDTYRPGRMVAVYSADMAGLPYPPDGAGRAVAYVCAGETCAEPSRSSKTLQQQIESLGRG